MLIRADTLSGPSGRHYDMLGEGNDPSCLLFGGIGSICHYEQITFQDLVADAMICLEKGGILLEFPLDHFYTNYRSRLGEMLVLFLLSQFDYSCHYSLQV